MKRLTLDQLPAHIPTPQELYSELMKAPGWPYKTNREIFKARDLALPSILYLGALRVSEAIPLIKEQFSDPIEDDRGEYILIKNVKLSKRRFHKLETNDLPLPLEGERAKFTQLIQDYLFMLDDKERLFPWSLEQKKIQIKDPKWDYKLKTGEIRHRYSYRMAGTARAYQIVKCLLPSITEHWLRAFGEDFFYVLSGKDLVATASHYKVDARTLAEWYLKRRHLEVKIR